MILKVMYLLLQSVSSAVTLELECKLYCDEHNSTLPSSNNPFAFWLEIHGGTLKFVEMEHRENVIAARNIFVSYEAR